MVLSKLGSLQLETLARSPSLDIASRRRSDLGSIRAEYQVKPSSFELPELRRQLRPLG